MSIRLIILLYKVTFKTSYYRSDLLFYMKFLLFFLFNLTISKRRVTLIELKLYIQDIIGSPYFNDLADIIAIQ